jgi:hypothetical protein
MGSIERAEEVKTEWLQALYPSEHKGAVSNGQTLPGIAQYHPVTENHNL